jgi:hypothetical protein
MQHVDPYTVMRNTETLERYRAHNRAAWAAGKPFLGVGGGLVCLGILSLFYRTVAHHPPVLAKGVLVSALMALGGAALVISAAKVGLYIRRHPFDPRGGG